MKIKIGVMGSADETTASNKSEALRAKGQAIAEAIAARDLLLLTGATTGLVYVVGKTAHDAGIFHVGYRLLRTAASTWRHMNCRWMHVI